MALIECPECGKMISDKAEFCVGCGYPIGLTLEEDIPYEEDDEITQEDFDLQDHTLCKAHP